MIRSPLIPLILAIILAFTSQTMAVARGASAATGQMVLCTGTGTVSVYTDAQGQPTGAPHFCPDCALNAVLGGSARLLDAPFVMARLGPYVVFSVAHAPTLPRLVPPSRAPPLSV